MKIFRSGLALSILSSSWGGAAILASTDFNGRTATANTASGLNWTTNGLADPGSMSSSIFGGDPVNLFDGTALTQNSFVPALNTGNNNTSWTTAISLVASGPDAVTVESLTFDYLAVNGGQAINVARRSDFTVQLLNPLNAVLATASAIDVIAGTSETPQNTSVTLTLSTAVPLSDPGTYTLVLRGGDFLGTDETGNHTGIDNLSINGTIAAIPEASTALLSGLGLLGLVLVRRRR